MSGSSRVVVALYRSLLRNAKVLDRHKCFKAILPPDFHTGNGKTCDFFTNDISCVATLRAKFRAERASHQLRDTIDDAIAVNTEVSKRVRVLYRDDQRKELLTIAMPPWETTAEEMYARKMDEMSAKDARALEIAFALLEASGFQDEKKLRASIKAECERAIELDPLSGDAYLLLANVREQQGLYEAAIELYEKAKVAPHVEARHLPCRQLVELYLLQNRAELALHEYIHMLYWMGPDDEMGIDTIANVRKTTGILSSIILRVDDKKERVKLFKKERVKMFL